MTLSLSNTNIPNSRITKSGKIKTNISRQRPPLREHQPLIQPESSNIYAGSDVHLHTLPPLPVLLELPSFGDFSLYPGVSRPAMRVFDSDKSKQAKLPLQLFHVNSPYVPWPSPLREQIIEPASTSIASTNASPTHSLHRVSSNPRVLVKVSSSVRNLRRAVSKNVKQVSRRLSSLTKSKDRQSDTRPETTASEEEFNINDADIIRPRITSIASCSSLNSANTTSLAVWLAARRRQSLDETSTSMGSWMNLENSHPFPSRCDSITEEYNYIHEQVQPRPPTFSHISVDNNIMPGGWNSKEYLAEDA